MTKKAVSLSLFATFLAAPLLFADTHEEVRTPGDFTGVSVTQSWDVTISKGDACEVLLKSRNLDLADVRTEIVDGKLEIHVEGETYGRDQDLEVYLQMPSLDSIEVSDSGDVVVEDVFTGLGLEIGLTGSGDIEMAGIEVNSLEIGMSGSGDVEIESGSVYSLEIGQVGSGDFEAEDLIVTDATLSMAGSGDATFTVTSSLTTNIAGSGSVYYKGNPVTTHASVGSGEIERIGD